MLTERGPTASTSNTNLTLNGLKRILQGLEGKKVGGSEEFDKYMSSQKGEVRKRKFGDDGANDEREVARKRRPSHNLRADSQNRPFIIPEPSAPQSEVDGEEGWQDKEDFEMMQQDVEGDAAEEPILEQPANEEEAEAMVDVEIENTGEKVDPRPDAQDAAAKAKPSSEDAISTPKKTQSEKELRKQRKRERRKEEKRQAQKNP